jgi:uncharacterized repeat protein (TIGR01451 family)
MAERCFGRPTLVLAGLLFVGLGPGPRGFGQQLTEEGRRQIGALLAEKDARTTTQRKLATSLLYASRESRGQAMVQGLPALRRIADRARVDGNGMVAVHIRGEVTAALLQRVAAVGGHVAAALPPLGLVRARVPVRQVEAIAALPEVRSIRPSGGLLANVGSRTSEGDTAHAAAAVRSAFGVDGTGVKVGVLSTGADTIAARQATGDLPPTCTTPPGTGSCVKVVVPQCAAPPCGYDEGTAMMEIVHDLAPGAQLYFAGTDPHATEEEFAANVETLRNAHGCDVIVDDITFFAEGAFQDGPIAQAVRAVRDAGALYFSAAGSAGRKDAGTSGTWEGDFVNSGTSIGPISGYYRGELPVHSFDGTTGPGSANSNGLTADADSAVTLKWSDALGAAGNDYDIFVLDSGLTQIWDGSVDDQGLTGEPYEEMGFAFSGERIVVVLYGHVVTPGQRTVAGGGAARALRLDTHGGRLAHSTAGAVFGHNAAEAAVTMVAADAHSAGGGAFTGGSANPVEGSDGPRRMFYEADGTAITPGNVLFGTGGGKLLAKPDLAAASCVTTTTPGFNPFCGTSAAAPHAAAIAALLLSATPRPSPAAVAAAMVSTALDVDPPGWDRNSGAGIVMADRAEAVGDIAVSMTGPAFVARGADAVYAIGVRSNGVASASDVTVSVASPAGLTFVSNGGDCTTSFPCSLGSMGPGDTRTVTATFHLTADYSGPVPFTTTATLASTTPDPIPANDASSVETATTPRADLAIAKSGPTTVVRGGNAVYTIVVSNGGPDAVPEVSVADATPPGLTFVSNAGGCATAFPCAVGPLAVGASRTITSTFGVPAGYSGASPVTNTAAVVASVLDPDPGNDSAGTQATVVDGADLSITKTGPPFAVRGADLAYTIVVTNAGPAAADLVEVADGTPAGLSFVSNAGDCTTAFPCSLGTVPAGASRTITSTFSVPADQDASLAVVNTAIVRGANDPDPSNDTDVATSLFGAFYTVSPCRLVDTRTPGQLPALQPGEERTFVLTGPTCGVPVGAVSVSLNLTVTAPTAQGNLALYPADVDPPQASTINFVAGQTRANNAIVPASADGSVAIGVKNRSTGSVHVVIDVNGYFE